jgi:hypothetical protein
MICIEKLARFFTGADEVSLDRLGNEGSLQIPRISASPGTQF